MKVVARFGVRSGWLQLVVRVRVNNVMFLFLFIQLLLLCLTRQFHAKSPYGGFSKGCCSCLFLLLLLYYYFYCCYCYGCCGSSSTRSQLLTICFTAIDHYQLWFSIINHYLPSGYGNRKYVRQRSPVRCTRLLHHAQGYISGPFECLWPVPLWLLYRSKCLPKTLARIPKTHCYLLLVIVSLHQP